VPVAGLGLQFGGAAPAGGEVGHHLRLPLAVRRWCRLAAGDRMPFAADGARGVLVAYPLAVLDRLLTGSHAGVAGGEAR
jgi:hypothetical protein